MKEQLSKNFKLDEFVSSPTADRLGIDNTPGEKELDNIIRLVDNVLQPLREYMNSPCKINSGYRSKSLNEAVNGEPSSRHMAGTAADISFGSKPMNRKAFEWIRSNCAYRQLINEYDFSWVHVEYDQEDNKGQCLVIK